MKSKQTKCEEICEKAEELGYTKEDFELKKVLGDGWVVIQLKDKDLTPIREYINKK